MNARQLIIENIPEYKIQATCTPWSLHKPQYRYPRKLKKEFKSGHKRIRYNTLRKL